MEPVSLLIALVCRVNQGRWRYYRYRTGWDDDCSVVSKGWILLALTVAGTKARAVALERIGRSIFLEEKMRDASFLDFVL